MNGSKKWIIKEQDGALVSELSSSLGIKEITARLLINRGYTCEESARAFLEKSDSFLYDPFLMKDMKVAAERVIKALDNGEKMPKDIKITFADKETCEFNRFSYIAETQVIDANATVCPLDKTMTAQNGVLTDSLGGNYGVYVYTTLPPIKQISLEKPFIHLRAGESAQIIAELIDCAETDEAEYSITEFTNEAGSITENGVFTASDKAQSGDKTAVRISLKNNPEIFAVAIIFID